MPYRTRNEVIKKIHDIFGQDIEIRDAPNKGWARKKSLTPLRCDAVGADPKDPCNCLLVHTAKREWGCNVAIFWKTTCYADMVGEDGVRRVYRFVLRSEAIRLIDAFDKGKPWIEGQSIPLYIPTKSSRLENRSKKSREWNASPAGKAFYRVGAARDNVKRAEERFVRASAKSERVRQSKPFASPVAEATRKEVKAALDHLRTRRVELHTAEKAAAKVKRPGGAKSYTGRVFDMGTRNGAIGNYQFHSAPEAARRAA